MANIDDLRTIKTQIIARITSLTASLNPDMSDQGRSISNSAYLNNLMSQLKDIDELIQRAEGPWKVMSRGRAV